MKCDNLQCVALLILDIFSWVITIIIAISLVAFLLAVLKYAFSRDDKTRQESKKVMLYGIIFLFVMISLWGLVNVLSDTFFDFFTTGHNHAGTQDVRPYNLKK